MSYNDILYTEVYEISFILYKISHKHISFKKQPLPTHLEQKPFRNKTRAQGITKGAAILQTKPDNYIRYLIKYIRYLINYIL